MSIDTPAPNADKFRQSDALLSELHNFEVTSNGQQDTMDLSDSAAHAELINEVLDSVSDKFNQDPRYLIRDPRNDYEVNFKNFKNTAIDAMTFICSDPRRAALAQRTIAWAARGTVRFNHHPNEPERLLWPHAIVGSVRTSKEMGQLLLAPILGLPGSRRMTSKRDQVLLADVILNGKTPIALVSDNLSLEIKEPAVRIGMTVSPGTPGSLVLRLPGNSKSDFRRFARRAPGTVFATAQPVSNIPLSEIDNDTFSRFNVYNHLGLLATSFSQVTKFDEITKSYLSKKAATKP